MPHMPPISSQRISGATSPRLPPLAPKQLETPTELKWAPESLNGRLAQFQRPPPAPLGRHVTRKRVRKLVLAPRSVTKPPVRFPSPRLVSEPLTRLRSPPFDFRTPRLVLTPLARLRTPPFDFRAPRSVFEAPHTVSWPLAPSPGFMAPVFVVAVLIQSLGPHLIVISPPFLSFCFFRWSWIAWTPPFVLDFLLLLLFSLLDSAYPASHPPPFAPTLG